MSYVCAPHQVRSLTSDYECTLPKLLPHPCFVFNCVCDPLVGTCLLDSTCGGSIRKVCQNVPSACTVATKPRVGTLTRIVCLGCFVDGTKCFQTCVCAAVVLILRCCSGSMRYVNKLSYKGGPPPPHH